MDELGKTMIKFAGEFAHVNKFREIEDLVGGEDGFHEYIKRAKDILIENVEWLDDNEGAFVIQ